ncbi:hypothetical protein DR73_4453 [Enterobacteriaceae bacterium ATCC 29904]|nr:hypothetical protein DR73_4453 [Enterobacteriaceae bacterium ATCC 29904]
MAEVNGTACTGRAVRAASTLPAMKLPAVFGATPFRARAFRRCGGSLLITVLVAYHPSESFRRG